jgi:hypothetical protein
MYKEKKIYTNDLKKGDMVLLGNGWKATMLDNKKGDIRCANVEGLVTESGDIYMHDVAYYVDKDRFLHPITHTKKQLELRQRVEKI